MTGGTTIKGYLPPSFYRKFVLINKALGIASERVSVFIVFIQASHSKIAAN
jgi:hypothetical protein